jgi:serine/threonine-protein kinase
MRILIEVMAGPHQGQTFSFDRHDTFLVGRSRRAHFRLPTEDRYFSRLHFLVEVNPPRCRLIDMGSKNGTYVNGQRVEAVDLRDGDQIQGGQTVLRVRVETDGDEEPRPVDRGEGDGTLADASPYAPPPARPIPALDATISLASGGCPLCGRLLEGSVGVVAGRWPICFACRESARLLPQPIRGYHLIQELDQRGTRFLALQEAEGRPVVLKSITLHREVNLAKMESFLREAAGYRELSHPYIAAFREVGECAGRIFFASDFVRGTDADRLVQEHGPLPIGEACELIAQVLEALEYAHARGLVHRDLKPANVAVTEEKMVRVLDFGLSGLFRISDMSGFSLETEVAGAVPFLAPEQLTHFRDASPASDQYSAAAVLYYLLTGKHTHDFPPDFHERVLLILQEEPVPIQTRRQDVPEKLAAAIHRALSKDPESRFADVTGLLHALPI